MSGTILLSSQLPTVTVGAELTTDGGGDVRVSGNDAMRDFAVNWRAKLRLRNITVADGNDFFGGAIANGGILRIEGSTISANSATDRGGGIHDDSPGTAPLSNTLIANNIARNCSGDPAITDAGYNLDDGTTCGFSRATGSLSNTDPLLDPAGLSGNGGPTLTIALEADSPAVHLVGSVWCNRLRHRAQPSSMPGW